MNHRDMNQVLTHNRYYDVEAVRQQAAVSRIHSHTMVPPFCCDEAYRHLVGCLPGPRRLWVAIFQLDMAAAPVGLCLDAWMQLVSVAHYVLELHQDSSKHAGAQVFRLQAC